MRYSKTFKPTLFVSIVMILITEACVHEPLVPDQPSAEEPSGVIEDSCEPGVVYFKNDIEPILVSNCAKSGCHDEATAKHDIRLNTYENIIKSEVIKGGDPDDSELYEKITETDEDDIMPPPPNRPLTPTQIALIRTWIQQGAKDNACASTICDTTNVTFQSSINPIIANKCVGCHSGATPAGNINLTSHQGVQTVALNGKLIGRITDSNAATRMPKGGSPLPDCEIEMIKIWIEDGALNN
jgi:hypothetical protein